MRSYGSLQAAAGSGFCPLQLSLQPPSEGEIPEEGAPHLKGGLKKGC